LSFSSSCCERLASFGLSGLNAFFLEASAASKVEPEPFWLGVISSPVRQIESAARKGFWAEMCYKMWALGALDRVHLSCSQPCAVRQTHHSQTTQATALSGTTAAPVTKHISCKAVQFVFYGDVLLT